MEQTEYSVFYTLRCLESNLQYPHYLFLCDKYGIENASLTTYLEPWDEDDIERVMIAANIMDCKNIRVNVPKYNESENYVVLFDKTVEQVKRLEKLSKKYGVRINFEIHMGNIIPSASAAYRFVSNFNSECVGIIFDLGNMVHEGFENYRLGVELLGKYLAHVHIKNAVWILTGTNEESCGQSEISIFTKIVDTCNPKGYNVMHKSYEGIYEKESYKRRCCQRSRSFKGNSFLYT